MLFLKNLAIVGLVTAFMAPAAFGQGNFRANATSPTFSITNPAITRDEIETFAPASRADISASLYYGGLLKAERGQLAQARADILKAIKVDRSNVAARVDYAFLVLMDDRPEQAKTHIEKAQAQLASCEAELTFECRSLRAKIVEFEATYAQTALN